MSFDRIKMGIGSFANTLNNVAGQAKKSPAKAAGKTAKAIWNVTVKDPGQTIVSGSIHAGKASSPGGLGRQGLKKRR